MSYRIAVVVTFEDEFLNISTNDLISAEYSSNGMDAELSMNPGVCEQNATVKFYDYSKVVEQRFRSGENTDSTITINVLDNSDNIIESRFYYSSYYDIDNDNDIVTINCIDNTKILKEISVSKSLIQTRTADDLLKTFFNYLPTETTWEYYDNDTKTRCQSIVVPNSWYREGTLEEFLNKICVLGLLRIFCVSNTFYVMRCI